MKIAIQFFGHLRTYRRCYRSIHRHLLSKYDCDVFMHTWSQLDHNTQVWHKFGKKLSGRSVFGLEDELKKIFHLKGLKVEEQVYQDMGLLDQKSIFGYVSLFHSMCQVNQLRERYQAEHGIEYDFVICLRPDLYLRADFDVEYFLKQITPEECDRSVFNTGHPVFGTWTKPYSWLATDVLFFARPAILCDIFSQQETFLDQLKNKESIITAPGALENVFMRMFLLSGYEMVFIKYLIKHSYDILRPIPLRKLPDRILKLIVNKKMTRLILLEIIPLQIFFSRLKVFGYKIDFCIGSMEGVTVESGMKI